MKKIYILFIFVLVSGFFSELRSQCSPKIPSQAIIVNVSDTFYGGGEIIWGCPGSNVSDWGSADTAFLEPNSTYNSMGGDVVIFAKSGCVINCYGGGEVVYKVSGVTVNDLGGNVSQYVCATMNFDYSVAPVQGCASGLSNSSSTVSVTATPNPASKSLTFIIKGIDFSKVEIEIFELTGQPVTTVHPDNSQFTIDITTFKEGMYFYKVLYKGTVLKSEKFIVLKK